MHPGPPDDVMTVEQIKELINRRQRQVLVHSVIYYEMDKNLITDAQWTKWAFELAELQKKYPKIAAMCPLAYAFEEFDGCSGFNLPLRDPWAVNTAQYLVKMFEGGYYPHG